jgi:hypothetical protein
MEPVKRTRSFDFDGHTFTITMAAPDTGIGVTQSAVIERDGISIYSTKFKPDQDIQITIFDILESDIRNRIIK